MQAQVVVGHGGTKAELQPWLRSSACPSAPWPRAGVATSALRFYEEQGLITSERASSGHRQYHADVLRRVAFIQAKPRVGLSLSEIRDALATLPDNRTPNRKDWSISQSWRSRLDDEIAWLERLRDDLDGCIGCGCLSLSVARSTTAIASVPAAPARASSRANDVECSNPSECLAQGIQPALTLGWRQTLGWMKRQSVRIGSVERHSPSRSCRAALHRRAVGTRPISPTPLIPKGDRGCRTSTS